MRISVGCRGFTELGLSTRRDAMHRLLMSSLSITPHLLLCKTEDADARGRTIITAFKMPDDTSKVTSRYQRTGVEESAPYLKHRKKGVPDASEH